MFVIILFFNALVFKSSSAWVFYETEAKNSKKTRKGRKVTMSMSKKSKIIIYVLLTLMALYFLSPFIYMLFTTFKTEAGGHRLPAQTVPRKNGWWITT